ncbi:MAG: hypothetical protein B6241_06790 [Spirochaetaceae bacterium 4572_59]|nr:MAG: hypothetical protein B6241_06790 [Spirochaetaceae bacterium 4572_59]
MRTFTSIHSVIFPVLLFSLLLSSCGEFIGLYKEVRPETGALVDFDVFLSGDELNILYDSVISDRAALCQTKRDGSLRNGEINIRGYTSRLLPKKSFTVTYANQEKIALDAGGNPWFEYDLAMYAYRLAGLQGVPEFQARALFVNDSYLGYYNEVELYNKKLNALYNTEKGELYKILLTDFGDDFPRDFPIYYRSEKKFPDNENFSLLSELLNNTANMSSQEWVEWVDENGDLENIARYMVVRDYFGIPDTDRLNFYIYFHEKFMILPWDSDRGYCDTEIGGNNTLNHRMLESEEFRRIYTEMMNNLFLVEGPLNILDKLLSYLDLRRELLDPSVPSEPGFFLEQGDYVNEYESIKDFFNTRGESILKSRAWKKINPL